MGLRSAFQISIIAKNWVNERTKWFIDLRWLAVLGAAGVVSIASLALNIDLPLRWLYGGAAFLAGVNTLFLVFWKRLVFGYKDDKTRHNSFANIQVATDLLMLTYFLHFGGSIENPFVYYFIFHMVIAGILLSNRAAYAHGVFAVLLIGLTSFLEHSRVIPHYHLTGFTGSEMIYDPKFLAGSIGVLASTLFITIFMAVTVVNKLRDREEKLDAANKMLAEQDRLKSRYVLTVSHDLKSSVSTIQSCLKVVLKGLTGSIGPKTAEMLSRAERRSIYMLNFISDLLNLSSIRADRNLRKNQISISMLAEHMVEHFGQRFTSKKIKFDFNDHLEEAMILANEDSIERVFVNLLENAVRYTPSGGKISMELKNTDGNIEVSIKDTGIGIAEEEQKFLFNDFYRAENARMIEKDGTGLGLSIVKQILDSHDGKIWLESRLGQGSRFTFTLPAATAYPAEV